MATTLESAEGYFKDIFASKLNDVIPDNAKLTKKIKFDTGNKLGEQYSQPVVLTNEQGVTYALHSDGVFDLNASINMSTKEAILNAVQFVIRSQMPTNFVTRAVTAGKQAFGSSIGLVVRNMMNSMTHRLESSILYGNKGIGKTSTSVNSDTSTTVVTITAATWAAGMWAGGETAKINFYNSTSQVSSSTDGDFAISAVDITDRKLTVTGTATGIAALDTAAQTSGVALDIYWKGSYGKEMKGIDEIVTNTGVLFNINAANYHLWKGNSYAVDGSITFEKITTSINDAVVKGLNGKVCAYMSPYTWTKLMQDLSGDRSYDQSYSRNKLENGTEQVMLYSQNGVIEIESHNMVKAGEAFILPIDELSRIGSTDITFNNPANGGKFFRELTDKDGFELKAYSEQSLFCTAPAKMTKLTGITN